MRTKEQKKAYNDLWRKSEHGKTWLKNYNASDKMREKRKLYKKTVEGKIAENRYRRNNYTKVGAERHLIQRYGISKEIYERMLEEQNYTCAICFIKKEERLHVDHSHQTGKVRGLLCGACNRALGLMKDNLVIMNQAVKYLGKYNVLDNDSN